MASVVRILHVSLIQSLSLSDLVLTLIPSHWWYLLQPSSSLPSNPFFCFYMWVSEKLKYSQVNTCSSHPTAAAPQFFPLFLSSKITTNHPPSSYSPPPRKKPNPQHPALSSRRLQSLGHTHSDCIKHFKRLHFWNWWRFFSCWGEDDIPTDGWIGCTSSKKYHIGLVFLIRIM